MRKLTVSLATLGLAACGLAVPATAHASSGCAAEWNYYGRDGYVRAWDGYNCSGLYLGNDVGSDPDWGDSYGEFKGADANRASSVMNNGYVGGKDVVAFYYYTQYDDSAYGCLKPGEKYVDDLSRDWFTNIVTMDNEIASHAWVAASACAPGSFIS
ncbi:hypothetical protein ACIQU5_19820 [Streptomyces sp. NPDC090306]|uniref:hypothetical protein n=1 Tax=unclassified Streptomyces TaxID=2593676 RepID=UPI0036E9F6CD